MLLLCYSVPLSHRTEYRSLTTKRHISQPFLGSADVFFTIRKQIVTQGHFSYDHNLEGLFLLSFSQSFTISSTRKEVVHFFSAASFSKASFTSKSVRKVIYSDFFIINGRFSCHIPLSRGSVVPLFRLLVSLIIAVKGVIVNCE